MRLCIMTLGIWNYILTLNRILFYGKCRYPIVTLIILSIVMLSISMLSSSIVTVINVRASLIWVSLSFELLCWVWWRVSIIWVSLISVIVLRVDMVGDFIIHVIRPSIIILCVSYWLLLCWMSACWVSLCCLYLSVFDQVLSVGNS
jgi:hypothetical protein